MRIIFICVLSFALYAEPAIAAPGNGKGKGKGAEKGNGKGAEKGKGNAYGRGKEKHKAATEAIANTIAQDSGIPAVNFVSYAANLADTLGQLDDDALFRVLGQNIGKLP
jgi:hypothetical protein